MSTELEAKKVQEGALLSDATTDDYFVVPKEEWEVGEWTNELDYLYFDFGDYPSLILRSAYGSLNGYIAVPEGHPWFLEDADRIRGASMEITWASHEDHLHPLPLGWPIAWWVGFSCSSIRDYMPALAASVRGFGYRSSLISNPRQTYKPIPYVRSQIEILTQNADHAMMVHKHQSAGGNLVPRRRE